MIGRGTDGGTVLHPSIACRARFFMTSIAFETFGTIVDDLVQDAICLEHYGVL
jgi:hypothetical protein